MLGTAMLLMAVVGSGITVGGSPSGLFAHAAVVGAALVALIVVLRPVSGAHLNPAVSIAMAIDGRMRGRDLVPYILAQSLGAVIGTVVANLTFGEPAVAAAVVDRGGMGLLVGEAVATGGLVLLIIGAVRSRQLVHLPYAVGAFVAAAIVFTSSASFANPAVTLGRAFTGTWTGIRWIHVPGFLLGQTVGAGAAIWLGRWLFDDETADDRASGDARTLDHSPATVGRSTP